MLESDHQEPVLLFSVLLALVLAVRQVQLLHREVIRLDLVRQPTALLLALRDLVLSLLDLVN